MLRSSGIFDAHFVGYNQDSIEARFRESKAFYEQIGHRSFVIVLYEMRVKISSERNNILI